MPEDFPGGAVLSGNAPETVAELDNIADGLRGGCWDRRGREGDASLQGRGNAFAQAGDVVGQGFFQRDHLGIDGVVLEHGVPVAAGRHKVVCGQQVLGSEIKRFVTYHDGMHSLKGFLVGVDLIGNAGCLQEAAVLRRVESGAELQHVHNGLAGYFLDHDQVAEGKYVKHVLAGNLAYGD